LGNVFGYWVVGYKIGRSLFIVDGVLPWIVANANNDASPIWHHIELALCNLAQHDDYLLTFQLINLEIFILYMFAW
jgi:hypothetical protein